MCPMCQWDDEGNELTMNLNEAWRKFRDGDGLTDTELAALIKDIEVGIPFLENRGETGGVLFKALLDRESLLGYQRARENRR